MDNFAIETKGLTRQFGGLTAVDGIELLAPAGAVYCFVGPNGAGKTTTIRMLLGLIRPTKGNMTVLGKSVKYGDYERFGQIGTLVEAPSFYPNLTGKENLQVISWMRRCDSASLDRVLQITHLEKEANRLVKTYSQGMRQRLGLAMALIGDPELLILDEPTNGLDPAGILEMRMLIRNLASDMGITVVISSHLLSEVEQIADTIGIINRGRLIFQGSRVNLQAKYAATSVIQVDRPEEAVEFLRDRGWPAELVNGMVQISQGNRREMAEMVRQLVTAEFSVFSAQDIKVTLEDIFLLMVKED